MSKEVLLDVRHLTQQFHLTKKIKVKAVDDVSFQIHTLCKTSRFHQG